MCDLLQALRELADLQFLKILHYDSERRQPSLQDRVLLCHPVKGVSLLVLWEVKAMLTCGRMQDD